MNTKHIMKKLPIFQPFDWKSFPTVHKLNHAQRGEEHNENLNPIHHLKNKINQTRSNNPHYILIDSFEN